MNIFYVPDPSGDMKIIEYSGTVLPDLLNFMDKIKDGIQSVMPELSLAKIRENSQTSGYAISLHLAEFVAKIAEMQGAFGDGLESAMKLALSAMKKATDADLSAKFDPILPQDETTELDNLDKEINLLGIESKRGAMKRRGLTETQITEKMTEIQGEKEPDQEYRDRVASDTQDQDGQNGGEE
jgi:hypothetical protein